MGRKNQQKMTGLNCEGRIERAEEKRKEIEEKKHQLRLELLRQMLLLPKLEKKK